MLKIKVNASLGGSLTSIDFNGEEMLHQPDSLSWLGQDVVIFPFTARLKDGFYLFKEKKYFMKNQGLARYRSFEVLKDTKEETVLLLKSDEKTLESYPFPFELKVFYLIENDKLTIRMEVKNTGEETMYFGCGFHPALTIPYVLKDDGTFDISHNYIDFHKEHKLTRYLTDESGSFLKGEKEEVLPKVIELDKSLFKNDLSYLYKAAPIERFTLIRKDGIKIDYAFNKAEVLTIWTKEKGGDFICLEPWWGLPDEEEPVRDLSKKKLINSLKPLSAFSASYSLTFHKA